MALAARRSSGKQWPQLPPHGLSVCTSHGSAGPGTRTSDAGLVQSGGDFETCTGVGSLWSPELVQRNEHISIHF